MWPVAAVTKHQTLRGLKQQKFFLSQSWRPEVQKQGVGEVGSFWRVLSRPLRQRPVAAATLAVPRSRLRLPISASVLVCPSPLRESLFVVSSDKDTSHTRVRARPPPVWPDLNSLHPHGACFPCFPKSSHSEVPVDVNLGEILSISAQASSAKGTRLSPYSAGGQKGTSGLTFWRKKGLDLRKLRETSAGAGCHGGCHGDRASQLHGPRCSHMILSPLPHGPDYSQSMHPAHKGWRVTRSLSSLFDSLGSSDETGEQPHTSAFPRGKACYLCESQVREQTRFVTLAMGGEPVRPNSSVTVPTAS